MRNKRLPRVKKETYEKDFFSTDSKQMMAQKFAIIFHVLNIYRLYWYC